MHITDIVEVNTEQAVLSTVFILGYNNADRHNINWLAPQHNMDPLINVVISHWSQLPTDGLVQKDVTPVCYVFLALTHWYDQ